MTHTEIENQLDIYLDGEASPSAALQIRSHLESCAGCREKVRQWLKIKAAFLNPVPESASESFAFKVMEIIRAGREPFSLSELVRWAVPTFAIMAVALFIIGAVPFESDQAFAVETLLTKTSGLFSPQEISGPQKDSEGGWMGLEVL